MTSERHSSHSHEDSGLRGFTLLDLYRSLFQGRWYILGFLVASVGITLYLNSNLKYVYRSTATAMVITQNPWESGALVNSVRSTPSMSITDQLQILGSRKLAWEAVQEVMQSQYADQLYLLGYPDKPLGNSIEQATNKLLASLTVKQVSNSNVLAISVEAPSGFEAAYLANTVAERFQEQNQQFSRAEYTELKDFLKEQLDQVHGLLAGAETRLAGFKEDTKLAVLDVETQEIVEQSAAARAQLNAIDLELQSNEITLGELRSQYAQGQSSVIEDLENLNNATIDRLVQEISIKEADIAGIRAKDETGSQQYITKMEDELRRLREALTAETRKISASGMKSADPLGTMQATFDRILTLDVENKALRATRRLQEETVQEYEQQIARLPETSLDYVRLTREVEINERLYRLLTEKYQENQVMAAGKIGNVQLIDIAEVPENPISPNKKLNLLIGIFVGLLLGLGTSLLNFLLDSRMVTPEDLKVFNRPVRGVIPSIDVRKLDSVLRKERLEELGGEYRQKVQNKLITHFSPKSPISEAYRSLRTQLLIDLGGEGEGRIERNVIMVTSSTTQEGKSLTCANLAVTIAQTGRRTLLIDADMRRPTAHRNFSLERGEGLSNLLGNGHQPEALVCDTDIDNLFVITAGPIPANPAELLGSQKMRDLVAWARTHYEFVIIDTPPVLPVTDPVVISQLVDGVMVVVRSRHSHRRELQTALGGLTSVSANILGMVLNDYDLKRIYGSYYYYYHYYDNYYYYRKDSGRKKRSHRRHRREAQEA
jgi:succinoglycan biosynthesis transport protein ExoP